PESTLVRRGNGKLWSVRRIDLAHLRGLQRRIEARKIVESPDAGCDEGGDAGPAVWRGREAREGRQDSHDELRRLQRRDHSMWRSGHYGRLALALSASLALGSTPEMRPETFRGLNGPRLK